MARFEQMNEDMNQVLQTIISSQQVCKLLAYSSANPLGEPDVADPSRLIDMDSAECRIYRVPTIPAADSPPGAYITVVPDWFKLAEGSAGVKEWILKLRIIVHRDLWQIGDKLRPFSLLHEIDRLFGEQTIVGIRKLRLRRCAFVNYNETHSGYLLSYTAVSSA
jgi:hypothetical protein